MLTACAQASAQRSARTVAAFIFRAFSLIAPSSAVFAANAANRGPRLALACTGDATSADWMPSNRLTSALNFGSRI